jgi:hypothetical protein
VADSVAEASDSDFQNVHFRSEFRVAHQRAQKDRSPKAVVTLSAPGSGHACVYKERNIEELRLVVSAASVPSFGIELRRRHL